MLLAALAPGAAATRDEGFVERAKVLYTLSGETPGANFGWAVSELDDVDRDGKTDLIVGEPFSASGATYVYSGRRGKLLHRFDGAPGDQQGYAIADAGDTSGDGVSDIVSGAPGVGPGHVHLYSGRTGRLLHTFTGLGEGDSFGSAVAGAGDVNRDGRADILVGAELSDAGGLDSGRAYVFSGRTYELLLTLDAEAAGDNFGSATDWTEDVDRDRVPDLIVGARRAGAGGKAYVFSGRKGKPLFEIDAPGSGRSLGWLFVAGVGDVNRDGRPDIYAADFGDASLGPSTGRAAVYSGRDGSLLRRLTSTTPGENFGFDTVGLGDLDHDRVPDLVVSAATGERVYVIAGKRR